MKRIIVVTDDTKKKLPEYNRWKNVFKRGVDISKILDCVPTDDIENEAVYREKFYKYLRPAKEMFYSSAFVEISNFSQKLSTLLPSEIFFISGRYGLIHESELIIPYHFHIKDQKNVELIDEKTNLLNKMTLASEKASIIILLLPMHYIDYFMNNEWFDSISKTKQIILVTSMDFNHLADTHQNITILPRKGVARIGKVNSNKIIEIIKGLI